MSPAPVSPRIPLLERELGLSLTDFLALPPNERANAAREAVADLHEFIDAGATIEDRAEPTKTIELARSLFDAVAQAHDYDAAARRALAGRVVTDGLLRRECDRDQNVYFSALFTRRMTHAVPDVVFQPRDGGEVAAALTWARRQSVPVSLRGAASTAMGGAVPGDAGLLLDTARLDGIDVDLERGCVSFGSGARMRAIHKVLADADHALPVFPSNLGGTYIGWLATGGIGLNAFGAGRAADPLLSAEVVLPSAERITLEPEGRVRVLDEGDGRTLDDRAATEWFRARGLAPLRLEDLAGSEGQFGVVTRLVVAIEPRQDLGAFLLAFDSARDGLAAVDWIRGCGANPSEVKFLSPSHLHHVAEVWAEEDAKDWRQNPGAFSDDSGRPWRRVIGPAELGVPSVAMPHDAGAFLFVGFTSPAEATRFAKELGACPGSPKACEEASVRFASDRFRPQQIKRRGPGLLAAEIALPAQRVPEFLPAAERLAKRFGCELDAEVYYLADGSALVLAAYLTDHRSGRFHFELLLAPALLDLAMARYEGKPYVLGRWQAVHFERKFAASEARRLRELKTALDARHVLSPGVLFAPKLKGVLGSLVTHTMGPGVRLARLALGIPGVGALVGGLLGMMPGPGHRRGKPTQEVEGAEPTAHSIGCVNCGECNSVCPIFHESKIRLPQMLTHIGESHHGGESVDASGSALLDLCMRCGNCQEVCQSGIPHLPLYDALQQDSDTNQGEHPERHVLLLERLRSSSRYQNEFLETRSGGYLKRAQVSLPGATRFLLQRAEGEAGPAATCIHCGACVDVCPTGANKEYQGDDPRWITTEQQRCIGCGTCVEVCPANHQNGGQTLRVMEAPTLDWFAAARDFASREST